MLDTLVGGSAVVANVAISVGVVVAVFQLRKSREANRLQREVFLADHERRKKQATIEFTHTVLERRREVQLMIRDSFGADHVNPTDARYADNEDLKRAVARFLNLMERISVGINIGVYDLHAFSRITGRSTIEFFHKLRPIIEHRRKEVGSPTLFGDFELMVKELEHEREMLGPPRPPDLAKILHS